MSTLPIAPHANEADSVPLTRVSRIVSITLLTGGLLFLVDEGLPTAYSLQTRPVETVCVALMLFGLALAWRRLLMGGIVTIAAWTGYVLATHGRPSPITIVVLLAAALDVVAGWLERRTAGAGA